MSNQFSKQLIIKKYKFNYKNNKEMDEQNDNINKKEEEIPKIDTKIKVNDTTGNNTNIINNIIINIEKEKNEKILDNNNMKKDNKKIKSQDSKKKHENKYFVI